MFKDDDYNDNDKLIGIIIIIIIIINKKKIQKGTAVRLLTVHCIVCTLFLFSISAAMFVIIRLRH